MLIVGKDAQSNVTDTVIFYLADYRFTDSQNDYIVNTWETVDLTALGAVQFLEFTLESSDEGQWGINTPAYFALDNLTYGTLGIAESNAIEWSVYPNPATSSFTVNAPAGKVVIYTTSGTVVKTVAINGNSLISLDELNAGSYIIELTTEAGISRKSVVKL